MMIRGNSLWLALLLALLAAGAQAQQPQHAEHGPKSAKPSKSAKSSGKKPAAAAEPVLEPKAIEILKAASSRLAAAHSLMFTAVISYESPSRLGPPLVYTVRDDVTLLRPDKLKVITPGDGPASEFYYDGKTMMAFEPAANLVAIADAPPTIDATLKAAYDSAAIYFPFTDMIVADPYAEIGDGLKHAFYIGQSSVVGGTTTDMVAIENNWQLDPAVAAEAFASSNAQAAKRIGFSRPDAVVPPGVKAPAKKKSSKAK